VALPVDPDLNLHRARTPAVEDLDPVEERRFQIRGEGTRDAMWHVRVEKSSLQALVLGGGEPEADCAGDDRVSARDSALVIGAGVVREVPAQVEKFKHARARRPHPRIGRLAGIAGHRHDTVHPLRRRESPPSGGEGMRS
jgi:hypothetical protein